MSDQVLDTVELLHIIEEEKRRRRIQRGEDAVRAGAVILGFTGLGFLGMVLYNVLDDTQSRVDEAIDGITGGFDVSPVLFTDEGFEFLNDHFFRKGVVPWLSFRTNYARAEGEFNKTGVVKGSPIVGNMLRHWEEILESGGLILPEQKSEALHPMDRVAGWVLANRRTYFGVGIGVAMLPSLRFAVDVLREVKDGRNS